MIYTFRRKNYKRYHTSLKLFVAAGNNTALAYDLGIPKSTVISWKNTNFEKYINHPITGSAEKDYKLFQKYLKNRYAQRIFAVYVDISDTFHSILQRYKDSINSFKETILPVINKAKSIIGTANTLKIFRISRPRYDMWIKNKSCSASPVGLCVRQYPNQLSSTEIAGLKELFSNFTYNNWRAMHPNIASGTWPLVSVYFKGIRDNLISFSQTTFYKYVKILGFNTDKIRKRPNPIGLRATFPNQFWHADVTIFKPLDNIKIYIYLVIDNFSRYILAWRASLELSAKIRWETLLEAYKVSSAVKPPGTIQLIVDGGSENKPIPLDPNIPIKKLIAQQDIIFSNSMIEAANKQLKYRYLFTQNLIDFTNTVKYLGKSIPEYNNIRPYGALKGLTPNEVYFKSMIPGKSPFDDRLKHAIEDRYIQNKLNLCQICID